MSKLPKKLSSGEELFALHLRANNIPFEREIYFIEGRQFKFDFVLTGTRMAIEIDGGNWTGGHSRGKSYEAFCRKINMANTLGWTVYRFTAAMVESAEAIDLILELRG